MAKQIHLTRRATGQVSEHQFHTRSLADWSAVPAYVLLAEPGAGKSEAFKHLAAADGIATCVKAIDFVTFDHFDRWRGKTLFIDGIDEMRADHPGGGDPLHEVRRRLDLLGCPRVRLSCRTAEWRGAVDQQALALVSPDRQILELTLEPLTDDEVEALLRQWLGPGMSAAEFMQQAEARGLQDLLGNPLLIELLARAFDKGRDWPSSRNAVMARACRKLVTLDVERNEVHRSGKAGQTRPPTDTLLQQAGLMAAASLLSGADRFSKASAGDNPSVISVHDLPPGLRVTDPRLVLGTGLFSGDPGARSLHHRTVAEFLGASAIADKVANNGLPFGRVLALMTGNDGGVVEPLRGLHAWLAVRSLSERQDCIARDPVGVLLYGDADSFTPGDKLALLRALASVATDDPTLLENVRGSNTLSALCDPALANTLVQGLAVDCQEHGHYRLLSLVLQGIERGRDLPALVDPLEAFVRNGDRPTWLRRQALRAWWHQSGQAADKAQPLLADIAEDRISDPDDDLCGYLLSTLFPTWLTALQALDHLHAPKQADLIGRYWMFWGDEFHEHLPPQQLPVLLDTLAGKGPSPSATKRTDLGQRVAGQVLVAGLKRFGDSESIERIHEWLAIGLDEHGVASSGSENDAVRDWLKDRPGRHLALLKHSLEIAGPIKDGHTLIWRAGKRLRQASLLEVAFDGMLEIAEGTAREEVAHYFVSAAAHSAVDQVPGDDRLMIRITDWAQSQQKRWPQARDWVEQVWQLPVDHWLGEDRRTLRLEATQDSTNAAARRAQIQPYVLSLRAGTPPSWLLDRLAMAYEGRYSDLRDGTPLERVAKYLGGTTEEAEAALQAFKNTLIRNDLPDPATVLELDRQNKRHFLHAPALLGARLITEADLETADHWPLTLASTLAAFQLTELSGEMPAWFLRVAELHPKLVADLVVELGRASMRLTPPRLPRLLGRLDGVTALAPAGRLMLPRLLSGFPVKANPDQLESLRRTLLPAAAALLTPLVLLEIARRKRALRSLDDGQRVSWLALSAFAGEQGAFQRLAAFVGPSQSRAVHLAATWAALPSTPVAEHAANAPATFATLIAMLGPHVAADSGTGPGWLDNAESTRRLVHNMIARLGNDTSSDATEALRSLRAQPALRAWTVSIDAALAAQIRAHRAATYTHASVSRVALTLANLAPANARDLAALLVAHLRETERQLRGASTNLLKHFWAESHEGWVLRPETQCRDELMEQLKAPLRRVGVSIEAEGMAAFGKRSDIVALCIVDGQNLRVPVEVKRRDHRDVWIAWRSQLDRLYTTDPAASGVGLYVVLWDGDAVRSHAGMRPASAEALEAALSSLMSPAERGRLHVVAIDLSWPAFAPRPARSTGTSP